MNLNKTANIPAPVPVAFSLQYQTWVTIAQGGRIELGIDNAQLYELNSNGW